MDINTATFYDDLETMPIYNFYKCLDGNFKYMYEDLKGDITEYITSVWNTLYNKFCEITFNSETQRYYTLLGEITWLEKRLVFAPILLDVAIQSKDKEEVIKELKKWKIFVSLKKDLASQINTSLTILNNSKTKIKRKKEELKDISSKQKQLKPISLSSQKAKLHILLGIDVDVKKCSVTDWLEYWNEVELLNSKK